MKKMQICMIFLFQFKLCQKAAENDRNYSNVRGPGTPIECTGEWSFKKFCSSDEIFEDHERSGRPSSVVNEQVRASNNANTRTNVPEIAADFNKMPMTIYSRLKEIRTSIDSINGPLAKCVKIKKDSPL